MRCALATAALCSTVALGAACAPNTCEDGSGFRDVRVAEDEGGDLLVTWSQGYGVFAELPDAYFEEVTLFEPGDAQVAYATRAELEPPRSIRIGLEGPRHGRTVVTLEFPDRMGFVDCTHPGMADAFFLELDLELRDGHLVSSTVEEHVTHGAL